MSPAAALARLAPLAHGQVVDRDWEAPMRGGEVSATSSRLAWRAVLGPAFALVLVLAVAGWWLGTWTWFAGAESVAATATSTGEDNLPVLGPIPGDVTVEVTTTDG